MAFNFSKRLEFFLENTKIHGIKFLSSKTPRLGRYIWAAILLFMLLVMVHVFRNFHRESVSIGIDTSYLNWNNTFPAVSLCLQKGRKTTEIANIIDKYYASKNSKIPIQRNKLFAYYRTAQFLLFINPNRMDGNFDICKSFNSTCGIDIDALQEQIFPQNCSEIISDVEFAGNIYDDCREIFKMHLTEMGYCFTANSILFYYLDYNKVPLKFDRASPNYRLRFFYKESNLFTPALYVHSPEEIPNFNSKTKSLSTRANRKFFFGISEIMNKREIQNVEMEKRLCRFPNETIDGSPYHYSFSTCLTDLRIKMEMKACNCTLPTSHKKYKSNYCDIVGLNCLQKAEVIKLTMENFYQTDVCLQSCHEMEVNYVGHEVDDSDEEIRRKVTIEIISLPSVRYFRDLTKTTLDFAVTIGGIVGLFFGASILSVVEVFYIWFIRKFY